MALSEVVMKWITTPSTRSMWYGSADASIGSGWSIHMGNKDQYIVMQSGVCKTVVADLASAKTFVEISYALTAE